MEHAEQRLEHAKKMVKTTFSVKNNNKQSGKVESREPKSPQRLLEGWAELIGEEMEMKSDLEKIFSHWIDQESNPWKMRLPEGMPR